MLTEITLEALRYFNPTALEALQMNSRYLRDLIDRNARSLPLRFINKVTVSKCSVIQRAYVGFSQRAGRCSE